MVQQVCERQSGTKAILPWKFRFAYIKITACLFNVLLHHILTSCIPGVIFSTQCLQSLTSCIIYVISWHCIYIFVTVWLLGILFQRQCHIIHLTNLLLGALVIFTLNWPHDLSSPLLSIIFVQQHHHCLTTDLICSHFLGLPGWTFL